MAGMPQQKMEKLTITEIRDRFGQLIVQVGLREARVLDGNGNIQSIKNSQMLTTSCNNEWGPIQLFEKPPRHIGICEQCRNPSFSIWGRTEATHGIVLMTNARLCECGTLCCPRHRKMCRDGKYRCLACAKSFERNYRIKSIFFRRER